MTSSKVLKKRASNKNSKQRILVVYRSLSSKRHFHTIRSKYNISYERIDYSIDPQVQLTNIADRNHSDLVLGIADSTSMFVSCLAKKLNHKYVSTNSIITMQHKGLFAKFATKYFPKHILSTSYINTNSSKIPTNLKYPLFIRPVRSNLSMSAYRVDSRTKLINILQQPISSKRKVARDWYIKLIKAVKLDIPYGLDINSYIIQPYLRAEQFTLDGFITNKKLKILGITRSVLTKDQHSFDRFEFPVFVPVHIMKKLEHILNQIILHSKLNNTAFNLEFFITASDNVIIIELNTRISAQFIPLFLQRYIKHPLEMNIEAAQGIFTNISVKKSPMLATCFILRKKFDSLVLRIPTKEEIKELTKSKFVIEIKIFSKENTKLSDSGQDEYSYRYASIVIKGSSKSAINREYLKTKSKLLKLIELKRV